MAARRNWPSNLVQELHPPRGVSPPPPNPAARPLATAAVCTSKPTIRGNICLHNRNLQVFTVLYATDDSVLIGAPTGSGQTTCYRVPFTAPLEQAKQRTRGLDTTVSRHGRSTPHGLGDKMGRLHGRKEIVGLTGETSADLGILEKGDVIICTPVHVCLPS